MNKKRSFVMMFVIFSLFVSACDFIGSKHTENAQIHNLIYNSGEPWIAVMGDEETVRLRYLLKEEDNWKDSEPCDCADGDYGYDVELDGVYYRVCNWYWWDPSRDIHSISYKNSADDEYLHAMINENDDIMIEIYDIVRERGDWGTEYIVFMDEHQKKSSQATLNKRGRSDDEKVIVSTVDTERLRFLLTAEKGWYQFGSCQCIGSYVLVLDNVQYTIDTSNVEHQVKYSIVGDNRTYGLQNDDKEIVQEVYDIVEKYIE